MTAALLFCLAGCGPKEEQEYSKEIFAMDTYMSLKAYGDGGEEAVNEAVKEINRLDKLLSTGKETSEVGTINKTGEGVLSADGIALMTSSLELNKLTDGAFDISIYPVMKLWGFTNQKYKVPDDESLKATLSLVDASKINFDSETGKVSFDTPQMAIDFGAIAKGYTSSRVADIFRKHGVRWGLINLGGNVQTVGTRPDGNDWNIAILDPDDEDALAGVISSHDKAIITSGGYERFFEENGKKYHHIIDPETGYPADGGLLSVTIVTDDGTLADGLSTSLFVMGKSGAISFWKEHKQEFQCVLVGDDGTIYVSDGLKDSFKPEGERNVSYF